MAIACGQFDIILLRAKGRGEKLPDVDRIVDRLMAPLVYRILFSGEELDTGYVERLVDLTLDGV